MSDTAQWYQEKIGSGPYANKTWEEKFWLFVDVRSPDECWLWTGKTYPNHYGCFGVGKKSMLAHRVSYQLRHGPIADGMNVCHDCPTGDNPRCVNPLHLWLGTVADNMADMDRKDRRVSLRGEESPVSLLLPEQVIEIRHLSNVVGLTAPEIAAKFGTSPSNIHSIANFESWKHIGGPSLQPHIAAIRGPKLTNEKVGEVKRKLEIGQTHQSIADEYGVSRESITGIATGKTWRHVP